MAKPLLDYLNQTKDYIDAHDEMKAKIVGLEYQIKEKDYVINNLQTKMKADSLILEEKSNQLLLCQQEEKNLPNTCPSSSSGIHKIQIWGAEPFKVSCVTSAPGWTVIQRRFNGSVDFNRNWDEYKQGFGDPQGEFFVGLEKLHLMTEAQPHSLLIQLRDVSGTTKLARYDNFKVGSETEGYSLKSLGQFTGSAGDSLSVHKEGKFKTSSVHGCAKDYDGPWWYTNTVCGESSLNGKYFKDGIAERQNGIQWRSWNSQNDFNLSLTFVQMMIKPKNY